MCMYMYMYMYIYIYTYTHTYIYIYIYIYSPPLPPPLSMPAAPSALLKENKHELGMLSATLYCLTDAYRCPKSVPRGHPQPEKSPRPSAPRSLRPSSCDRDDAQPASRCLRPSAPFAPLATPLHALRTLYDDATTLAKRVHKYGERQSSTINLLI